jgi:uncharacterized membrane protein YadS
MPYEQPRVSEPKALLIALVAAATVCAVAMFSGAVLLSDTQALAELLPWALLYFLGGLWIGTIAGLPAFLVLRRRRLARWWTAMSMGAVLGAAFSSLLNQGFGHMISMAGAGAVSASAFWFTWRKLTGEARAT